MTGADLITDIRAELTEGTAAFFSDAEILTWINRGESDFVGRTRCLETSATIDVTAGRADYPLPANWLAAKAVFYNDVNADGTANWKRLFPTNLEKMAQERPNFLATDATNRGVPSKYFIWGNAIHFEDVPETTGRTVKLFFKCKPTRLASADASLNVDDTLADAIKDYALWRGWKKEKELDLAAEARGSYDVGVRKGLAWVKKRSGDQVYVLDARSSRPLQQ